MNIPTMTVEARSPGFALIGEAGQVAAARTREHAAWLQVRFMEAWVRVHEHIQFLNKPGVVALEFKDKGTPFMVCLTCLQDPNVSAAYAPQLPKSTPVANGTQTWTAGKNRAVSDKSSHACFVCKIMIRCMKP